MVHTALLSSATALSAVPAAPAHADVLDVWTTYSSMGAGKDDLINLNNACFGLRNGTALGVIDAASTHDGGDY